MKIGSFCFCAILLVGGFSSNAQDKSKLQDARKEFEKADADLNAVYKSVLAQLDKTKTAQLRDNERAWIAYRDFNIAAGAPSERTAEDWSKLAVCEQNRAAFLRSWTDRNASQNVTGEYYDSYGGTLELKETKDDVFFSLEVYRGRAHNEGEMGGTITIRDNKAYFKEKLDPGEAGPPCELAFTFIDGHIVRIEEKVPSQGVGFNVHFGGDYYKIGNLKKTEQ